MYDIVLVAGVEKCKDTGVGQLTVPPLIPNPLQPYIQSPAAYGMAGIRYAEKYRISMEDFKKTIAKIARETERQLPYEHLLMDRGSWLKAQTDEMISYNACYTAHRLEAVAIVASTRTGTTARRISRYRPRMPIVAITTSKLVYGRLLLSWGVQVSLVPDSASVDELFTTSARLCKDLGLARAGDLIVITGGIPIGVTGTTNLLKVEKIT